MIPPYPKRRHFGLWNFPFSLDDLPLDLTTAKSPSNLRLDCSALLPASTLATNLAAAPSATRRHVTCDFVYPQFGCFSRFSRRFPSSELEGGSGAPKISLDDLAQELFSSQENNSYDDTSSKNANDSGQRGRSRSVKRDSEIGRWASVPGYTKESRGINFRTTPVEIREKLSIPEAQWPDCAV